MGIFNAAFDAADNIARVKEEENRKNAAKALAKKKAEEKMKNNDNFSLF